jgi:carbon-monoxide dehydrogenase medium subunit
VLPILNCGVKLCFDPHEKHITSARIALGPVGTRPTCLKRAAAALVGKQPNSEAFTLVAAIAKQESNPRSSIHRASREYRLTVIPAVVKEALARAVDSYTFNIKTIRS